jgi:hypothetical protein
MAAYVGKDGDIYMASTGTTGSEATVALDSWTLNPSIDTVDTTVFGSSFRSRGQTLKDWTIEASGTLDRTNAKQSELLDIFESGGTLENVSFKAYGTTSRSTKYWSGSAVLNSASVVSAVADKVTVSFSLQANGALTWTGA